VLILFEDEHLLVINKPAGMNTHSPSPYAGEGIYEWLRNREPRWSSLAIVHRLDKETSGVMVFGKSDVANRSLTQQFAGRELSKRYLLLTDRKIPNHEITARSYLTRLGDKYISRPTGSPGELAETRFRLLKSGKGTSLIEAAPLTGRTHQIRVHAAEHGFPVLGDTLYSGTGFHRLCLHSHQLSLRHPATKSPLELEAAVDFEADSRQELRKALVLDEQTNACRVIHGAADHEPGWYVDRLGDFLLSQSEANLLPRQRDHLMRLLQSSGARGIYHKRLTRQIQKSSSADVLPEWIAGELALRPFTILENNVRYELSFEEGYSVGIFLDQRDNRRRFLTRHVAAGFELFHGLERPEVLNTFAYTCAFSVCAALAGARVTSLDLSRKYLDWGKRNFTLNNLNPADHDFIYGDAFDWMRRLEKKARRFDAVILDPPTFSQSKQSGTFHVQKHMSELLRQGLALLKPAGTILVSTNAATWPPEQFIASIKATAAQAKRRITTMHYSPQPPDFPVTRAEPAYLKTLWIQCHE